MFAILIKMLKEKHKSQKYYNFKVLSLKNKNPGTYASIKKRIKSL